MKDGKKEVEKRFWENKTRENISNEVEIQSEKVAKERYPPRNLNTSSGDPKERQTGRRHEGEESGRIGNSGEKKIQAGNPSLDGD